MLHPEIYTCLMLLNTRDGVCRTKGLFVYEEVSDNKSHCEMDLIEEKYSGRTISPQQISQDPGRYILCFPFYDMKHLLDIAPESCSYIYSSSEAYSEDQEINHLKLFNWLRYFNTLTYGIQLNKEDGNPVVKTEPGYHASGHISPKELERFIQQNDRFQTL